MKKSVIIKGNEYPWNWLQISREIKDRDGWHCKWCNNAHGQPHHITGSKVILTVHHLGWPKPDNQPGDPHDKFDCRDENLVALCQRCHLWADLDSHMAHAAETRRRKKIKAGQLELMAPWC